MSRVQAKLVNKIQVKKKKNGLLNLININLMNINAMNCFKAEPN